MRAIAAIVLCLALPAASLAASGASGSVPVMLVQESARGGFGTQVTSEGLWGRCLLVGDRMTKSTLSPAFRVTLVAITDSGERLLPVGPPELVKINGFQFLRIGGKVLRKLESYDPLRLPDVFDLSDLTTNRSGAVTDFPESTRCKPKSK